MRLLLQQLVKCCLIYLFFHSQHVNAQSKDLLQIHYINVGQGGSTLIVGPNGTRILYDFGAYKGNTRIVPYLRDKLQIKPESGIHYTVISHRDKDHYMGFKDVIEAGYDILVANYDSGSDKRVSSTMHSNWILPAKGTTAGPIRPIPVGLRIALGNGAEAIVMAANGKVFGKSGSIKVENENDKSISLFINYKNFQYILDGDLGSGPESCTDHKTIQVDVQSHVANALIRHSYMNSQRGVDVMHVAHHGSESSTSSSYYNLMLPEVGLISVGLKNARYLHPREDVVESVLIGADRPDCVTAPRLNLLLQTEDGEIGSSSSGSTSNVGTTIGNIFVSTDGNEFYTIRGDNEVRAGSSAEADLSKVWKCKVDETPLSTNGGRCILVDAN